MANRLEFSAKTVDSAIQEACRELNTTPATLAYEVVSQGASGIFGLIGVKKARIRVFDTTGPEKGVAAPAGRAAPPGTDGKETPHFIGLNTKTTTQERDATAAHHAGMEALKRIVSAIDPSADIHDESRGTTIHYSIHGKASALLIGKHGQTLEAIQYLIEKIVSRSAGRRVDVEVDVEGYAEKRRKQLKEIAYKQAEKARRTGKPTSIGHMSASDRRIVHLALKQDRSVRTQSTGEGPVRKLMVIPRRSRSKNR